MGSSSMPPSSALLLCGFWFLFAAIHDGMGGAAAQGVDQATMSELQHELSVTEWDRGGGGQDYCSWRGVSCDGPGGAVVSLTLPHRNLRGNLSLVTGLKSLRRLDLSANSFRGPIPGSIGEQLLALEYLDLSMNKLEGPIPPTLGAIRGLRSLNLSNNVLTGEIPQELKGSDGLEELQISANGLNGSLPYWMGNLTKLRVLSAYENQLVGVIPRLLGSVSDLQVLNLHSNQLEGPIPESVFASGKLEVLVLTLNRLNGSLPESVGSCIGLSNLRIGNNLLVGRIPTSIGNISSLTYFEADSNQLTGDIPPGFARCSNLTLLNLANNRLTGSVPLELGQLRNLQEFIVSGNNLSGEIPLPLLRGKNLNKLDLSNNEFNGTLPDNICAPSRLQFLMLNQNFITGRIPAEIGNCGRLLELQLGNNYLTGDIPREIGKMKSLQIALNLSSNRLSGPLPPELGKLDKLVTLDVSNNLLTGNIPSELRGMLSLIELNFSSNQFTGEIPLFTPFQKAPSSSFSGNKGLCGDPLSFSCVDLYDYDDGSHHKVSLRTVLAVVGSGFTVFAMVIIVVALFMRRERQEMAKKAAIAAGDITASPPAIAAGNVFTENLKQAVDFEAVVKATMKDANKFSSGTFSTAYKAVMPSGMVLMVKRLKSVDKTVIHHQSKMIKELERLANVSHKNLMRPIGFIIYEDVALLLHHFIPNGTLAQLIHDETQAEHKPDWPRRLSIALGVAEGLTFLHHVAVVHLDISSGNIFLDAHFNALIGEIEISKLLDPSKGTASISAVAGSFGYIPPEYAYTMQVTAPGNVYSYGVLLLEILTSRWPIDEAFGEGIDLVKWVHSASKRGETPEQIMDSRLSTVSFSWRTQMLDVLKIAILCTDPTPAKRPKMKKVVEMLLEVNKG